MKEYAQWRGVTFDPKIITMDKWDPYLSSCRAEFPRANIHLCDWHEGNIYLYEHY